MVLGTAPYPLGPLACKVQKLSILFPHFLNIYMKLLGEVIQRSGLNCHQHVDDTQLCLVQPEDPKDAVITMNMCLEAVLEWKGG